MSKLQTIQRSFNAAIRVLKNNAPSLLSASAAVGVIGTGISCSIATAKTMQAIKIESEKGNAPEKAADYVRIGWKNYIIPATVAGLTIFEIFYSNRLHLKKEAALLSALSLTEAQFREYSNGVKDFFGEEHEGQMTDLIADEKERTTPYAQNAIDTGSGNMLFFEPYSKQWFKASEEYVLEAEYHINRNFVLGQTITLNEWYRFLGIPTKPFGDALGWDSYTGEALYGYCWIDFWNRDKTFPDGTKYISIEYPFAPHNYQEDLKEITT